MDKRHDKKMTNASVNAVGSNSFQSVEHYLRGTSTRLQHLKSLSEELRKVSDAQIKFTKALVAKH